MRPSAPGLRSGEGGSEHDHAQERADSPSPSVSVGSFPSDDEEEGEEDTRDPGPSSTTSQFRLPTTATFAPIQKAKRTRQLTTPAQAAVLHELLSRSRFPSTIEREEVGRRIGLSPRKVQNQRQKAKKASRDAEASVQMQPPGAPHWGHFPQIPVDHSRGPAIAPGPAPTSESSVDLSQRHARTHSGDSRLRSSSSVPVLPPISTIAERVRLPPSTEHSEPYPLQPSAAPYGIHPATRLTGPGVPGASSGLEHFTPSPHSPPTAYRQRIASETTFHVSHPGPTRASMRRDSHGIPEREHETLSHLGQLPPLQIDPRHSPEVSASREHVFTSPSGSLRESSIARFPSSSQSGASPMSSRGLPPPFTLEPNPVWSTAHTTHTTVRPGSSLGVRHSPTFSRTVTAPVSVPPIRYDAYPAEGVSRHPPRLTRFDPVRDRDRSPPEVHRLRTPDES